MLFLIDLDQIQTHILLIDLDQISCLQCIDGLSDMEKVCRTGKVKLDALKIFK